MLSPAQKANLRLSLIERLWFGRTHTGRMIMGASGKSADIDLTTRSWFWRERNVAAHQAVRLKAFPAPPPGSVEN